jgi:hypothetical protein
MWRFRLISGQNRHSFPIYAEIPIAPERPKLRLDLVVTGACWSGVGEVFFQRGESDYVASYCFGSGRIGRWFAR